MLRKLLALALALVPACGGEAFEDFDPSTLDGKGDQVLTQSIDVLRYGLTVQIDAAAATYSATATLDVNVTSPVPSVALDLDGAVVVDRVSGGADHYRRRGDRLYLLRSGRFPAGPTQVTVSYHAALNVIRRDPSAGCPAGFGGLMSLRTADGGTIIDSFNWPSYARRWIPSHDHPSDGAAVDLEITIDRSLEVVSNGALLGVTDGAATRTWRFSEPNPIPTYGIHIAAFPYVRRDLDGGGDVPITAYLYPQQVSFAPVLEEAKPALDFFRGRIGPYPWAKYDMVVAPTCVDGMEEVGAVTLDQSLFSSAARDELRDVVVHELAHQWMGDGVRIASWNDFWINEGFAEHLTALYLRATHGDAAFADYLSSAWSTAHDAESNATKDHAVRPPGAEVDVNSIFDDLSYAKADWLLHSLRMHVGDDVFWNALRRFYGEHRFAAASTRDLEQAFEVVSGVDASWFFEQFVYTEFHPQLRGTLDFDAARGVASVTVEQIQTRGRNEYQIPLEIELISDAGERLRETVQLARRSEAFTFTVPFTPTRVVLDPEEKLYADIACASAGDCPTGRTCHTAWSLKQCSR